MAIQRIGGQMLESNLTRVSDLAFQTNLLFLDVSNSRVGIRTAAPGNFALDVNGTARFQNSVEISGDLTVTGTTTTVDTQNLTIEDNIIILNSSGSIGNDAGIMINRGSAGNNAAFYWDETADKFKIVTTTSDGSTVTNINDTAYARLEAADAVDNYDIVNLQSMTSYVSAAIGATLGTFSFSGNTITQDTTNADFEMETTGTGNFVLSSTTGLILPKGNTAQRPTGQTGIIRFNNQTSKYEVCLDGSTWTALKTETTSKTVLKDVFAGDGSTRTFISANVTTAPENLIVYIDSVMQEPDVNYTTDGTTSAITITDEAPHLGARIVVISGFADDLI